MIIKVQRPISTPPGQTPVHLIYDQARNHVAMTEVSDVVKTAMGNDLKSYHDAEWCGDHWEIGARVADQAW